MRLHLPKGILEEPDPVNSCFFENVNQKIADINDEYIRIEKEEIPDHVWLISYALVLFVIGLPFIICLSSNTDTLLTAVTGVPLFLALSYTAYRQFVASTDYPFECEFNRSKGMVIYYQQKGAKRSMVAVPFSDCTFEIVSVHLRSGPSLRSLYIIDTTRKEHIIITFKSSHDGLHADSMRDVFKHHSLLQWYMDRNRPLPPGIAFDLYRQKDFEQRREQGFPKPLTSSLITILDMDGKKYDDEETTRTLAYTLLKQKIIVENS